MGEPMNNNDPLGDDDDDFGDFGGFEAAESEPNVAVVQPAGVEASPSPWAILGLGSDSVGVRPDLLCGQNRFPPVLDPNVPAPATEGASAAAADNNVQTSVHKTFPSHAQPLDIPGKLDQFEEASYVNDILDGSFRSNASSHSNPQRNLDSHSTPMPDVGADLVANGLDLVSSASRHTIPPGGALSDVTSSLSSQDTVGSSSLPQTSMKPDITSEPVAGGLVVVEVDSSNNSWREEKTQEKDSLPISSSNVSNAEDQRSVPTGADNSALTCPVYMKKAKEENWTNSASIQNELSTIKKESKLAVQSVVDEYKTFTDKSITQQQEMLQRHLQEARREQEKQLQLEFDRQSKVSKDLLEEEKQKMMEELLNLAKEQLLKQKEEFEQFLEEERSRIKEKIEEAVQKEREESQARYEENIVEERGKFKQALQEQKEEFEKCMKEDRENSSADMQKLLEEERKKFKEHLQSAIEEERTKHRDYMKNALDMAKDQVEIHLKKQKELDSVVRQRQLSSLEIFLESAREQLTKVMKSDNDNHPSNLENSEAKDDS